MPGTLGKALAAERTRRGWSLREVEKRTGIHNAHLSQIESGTIERPDPAIIWTLAQLYQKDYSALLTLAGLAGPVGPRTGRRSLTGAALRVLDDLTPSEQKQVLAFIDQIRKSREQKGR
jgi:transcriptional regulator with XRE-family HTH domain